MSDDVYLELIDQLAESYRGYFYSPEWDDGYHCYWHFAVPVGAPPHERIHLSGGPANSELTREQFMELLDNEKPTSLPVGTSDYDTLKSAFEAMSVEMQESYRKALGRIDARGIEEEMNKPRVVAMRKIIAEHYKGAF